MPARQLFLSLIKYLFPELGQVKQLSAWQVKQPPEKVASQEVQALEEVK